MPDQQQVPSQSRRGFEADPLLSTLWRDEYGHTYRVVAIVGSGSEDPDMTLRYVEPPMNKRLSLSRLRETHEETR